VLGLHRHLWLLVAYPRSGIGDDLAPGVVPVRVDEQPRPGRRHGMQHVHCVQHAQRRVSEPGLPGGPGKRKWLWWEPSTPMTIPDRKAIASPGDRWGMTPTASADTVGRRLVGRDRERRHPRVGPVRRRRPFRLGLSGHGGLAVTTAEHLPLAAVEPVTDDGAPAVAASRRHGVDSALEAVENVAMAIRSDDLDRPVVVVAANFTDRHERRPGSAHPVRAGPPTVPAPGSEPERHADPGLATPAGRAAGLASGPAQDLS